MLEQSWSSWGASVIGPLHDRMNMPNQDSWMAHQCDVGHIVVVSDGLGSKQHSDQGSKAACLSVVEAAKHYSNHPEANIADVVRLVHAYWLVKIAPFSPENCAATCLFALQLKNTITLGRLGDGMIAVYGTGEDNSLLLYDNKEDSFSNYTNSFQRDFILDQWSLASINADECKAVVLCTDGISDDILPEKRLDFVKSFVDELAPMTPHDRIMETTKILHNWPVPKHSDDKTIACLFKPGDHT
ncbi:MAG: hypothetical protein CMK59_14130 [Proteobacteria bacterium]|nr:hypothetical protein [Pseudomonadota bacterium]